MSESALSALFLQNPQLAIALRRKMEAEGLVKEGSSGEPIRSPWQGVNRLAQGLLGGYQARQADDEIKSGMERDNAEVDSFQKQMAAALMGQQGGGAAPAAPAMPGASTGGAPSAPTMTAPGGPTQARAAYDYYIKAGWQPHQAAALAAQFKHESNFNPTAVHDGGIGFGALGWNGDRRTRFAEVIGKPIEQSTLEDQYRYFDWELRNGPEKRAGTALQMAQTPEEAGAQLSRLGVRPRDVEGQARARGLTSAQLYAQFNQPQPQAPAATDTGGGAAVPRETPPAAPMGVPQQAAPPQAMPGNRSALMDIYLDGISSRNPRVQKIAAGLAPFLAKEQTNLQIQNVGGQMVAINPRDGSIVRTLGPSENFTPVPQSVEEQKRRLGAPYQELPRTPERMAQEQALRPPTTLSPGQQAFGPDGRPIAAVPDRPQSVPPGNVLVGADGKPIMNNPDRSKEFGQTDTLRGEYTKLTTDFRTIQDAHQKIMEASRANTGAGDMAMLYSFVKILDPTSVVRESEFATAAASGSFGERVQGAVQRVLSGQRLPDSLRKDFTDQADGIFRQQRRSYDNVRERFRELSKSFGLDPDQVTIDYVNPQAAPTAPASPPPGQPARRDPNDPLGLLTPRPR